MTFDGRVNTSPEVDREAARLRTLGLSWQKIGEALGISDKTAKQAAERSLRGDPRPPVGKVDLKRMGLLIEKKRVQLGLTRGELEVLRRRLAGQTLAAIGEELGISRQRVSQLQKSAEKKLEAETDGPR